VFDSKILSDGGLVIQVKFRFILEGRSPGSVMRAFVWLALDAEFNPRSKYFV
jgi:hypothetical protein